MSVRVRGAVIMFLVIISGAGCWGPQPKRLEGVELLSKPGWIVNVDQEARNIFDRFGTNEDKFLYDYDLRDSPAIKALGNGFALRVEDSMYSRRIRIRYGTHRRTRFVLIFDPRATTTPRLNSAMGFFQVSSNIYATR